MDLGAFFANGVLSGGLLLGLPLAFVAGIVSFLSPCVLPLLPGYLGYVSGYAGEGAPDRRRLLLGAALFVLGFTAVFVAYGAAFGAIGVWLTRWQDPISRALGVVVLAMGLVFVGRVRVLQRTARPKWMPATGLAGAPLLGTVFGLGWTPCIGPTLSAVISLSLMSGSAARGGVLAAAYCLGIGLPLLLIALLFGRTVRLLDAARRHVRTINVAGGAVLVVMGVLMVTGVWNGWIIRMQGFMTSYATVV